MTRDMPVFPATPGQVPICADDFAFNPACSEAIAKLALAQKIQATSALVLSPHWMRDAPLLQAVRGRLSVGLHLDWTSRYALSAGHGMGLGEAMMRAALGRFPLVRTRQIVAKQLDLFEACWGAPPDHIDGHQHVHQFAGIREALLAELTARYPRHRPWIRISNPANQCNSIKTQVIRAQGASRLKVLSEQLSFPYTPFLSGIYDFRGGEGRFRQLLGQWKQQAQPGTVIMCHPGTAIEPGDSHGDARVWEYAVLSS